MAQSEVLVPGTLVGVEVGKGATRFLDSMGDGEHETFPFVETSDVPCCMECAFSANYPWVAPRCNCQGACESGRSYFKRQWKF